ncbi:MAG: prenyltransferase [Anaerolineales bacterium]|nr:prenyltransferase [Anaerolineales bacterium]
MSKLQNWIEVLKTSNLPADREPDLISRWLIITRAAVISMTLTSGLIGGLMAVKLSENPDWLYFSLALIGLAFAHISNNLMNDYFDYHGGVDTDDYTRAQYAPHPILSGFLTEKGLIRSILVCNSIDFVIMVFLALQRGWPVVVFALLGLFISIFYVAPPFKLKHHGFGEPSVFLIWGPLMIGGTYFVTAGVKPPTAVWLSSVPYALLVTTVLIGKHIDKLEEDKTKGIHTIPVLLGEAASKKLNSALMIAFYPLVIGLVAVGMLDIWALLVLLALPRLLDMVRMTNEPKPESAPPNIPNWPLWYVSIAFIHARPAGAWFILGLILNILVPVLS